MHPRQLIAHRNDHRFLGCQLLQPLMHGLFIAKVLGELHVGGMMAHFGFEQAAVEIGQLFVRNMISQE